MDLPNGDDSSPKTLKTLANQRENERNPFIKLPSVAHEIMTEHMNAKTVNSLSGTSKILQESFQNFGAKEKALERTCLASIKEPTGRGIHASNFVCEKGFTFKDIYANIWLEDEDIEYIRTGRAFNKKCTEDSRVCTKVAKWGDYPDDDDDEEKVVNIREGTTMIGPFAFRHSPMKKLIIPNTVTNIGVGAFWNCSKLERVVIPESVKIIQSSAFRYCFKLQEVIMPKGISYIGDNAFENCVKLNLIFQNDVPYMSRDNRESYGPGREFKQITFRINFKEIPEFQLPFGTGALAIHENNFNYMQGGRPKIVIESVN